MDEMEETRAVRSVKNAGGIKEGRATVEGKDKKRDTKKQHEKKEEWSLQGRTRTDSYR